MRKVTRLSATTALATLIAIPASADVSGNDVWNAFTTYYQAVGVKLEATEQRTGNRLRLNDLKIQVEFPFDLGSFTATTTGFELIENADGTVGIMLPDEMPMAIALSLPKDIFVTTKLNYGFSGYQAQASGDPEHIIIKSSMDSMTLGMDDLHISGADFSDQDFEIKMQSTMRGSASKTTISLGGTISLTQNFSYDAAQAEIGFSNNDRSMGAFSGSMSILLNKARTEFSLVVPSTGIDLMNLPAQLHDGLSFEMASSLQRQHVSQRMTMDGKAIQDQTTDVKDVLTSFGVSKDGVFLKGGSGAYNFGVVMDRLPTPLEGSISKLNYQVAFPILKSGAEQSFTYLVDLDGIKMSDGIWDQFDPDSILPRDPARFLFDLSGKLKLAADLLDFEALKNTKRPDDVGELISLNLNGLDITGIGAHLTGTGAFSFDSNDLETYGGFPAPSGKIRIDMSGLNAVLDGLIELGALPNDAAFGVRMGLGLVAVAGDAEDTLVSEIEVLPNGEITANGKRVK